MSKARNIYFSFHRTPEVVIISQIFAEIWHI